MLVGRAFREITANPDVDRAEALRRSMLALIEGPHPHPGDLAPFVVVGDGAR